MRNNLKFQKKLFDTFDTDTGFDLICSSCLQYKCMEYCKSISAPEITSWDDIKTKFGRWKQNLSNKIERRKKTGAPRADDFDEAELLISAIINENPCLQKCEVL